MQSIVFLLSWLSKRLRPPSQLLPNRMRDDFYTMKFVILNLLMCNIKSVNLFALESQKRLTAK